MASLSTVCRDDIRSASTVLVFDSPFGSPAGEACHFLCQSTRAETQEVLSVLLTESPSEYLRSWTRSAGRRADRLQIISVDPGSSPVTAADSSRVVDRVNSPGNLTALGVAITKALSEWDDEATEIAVCFDSLTPLLQYVELDRAARFLQELTNRFDAMNATAHVHIDPKAHDKQTIGTLVSLFDEVVDLTESRTGRIGD